MRLLVRCEQCNRHYDASGRQPGDRFRCYCNGVVEVQAVQGHNAAVVRCGACGAPRTAGATHCAHCRAAFDQAERQRNTICPDCMTRVADQAKFCHNCGTELGGESVQLGDSELNCPACEQEHKLVHRMLQRDGDELPILECPSCAGFWIEHQMVERLTSAAQRERVSEAGVSQSKPSSTRPAVGW